MMTALPETNLIISEVERIKDILTIFKQIHIP